MEYWKMKKCLVFSELVFSKRKRPQSQPANTLNTNFLIISFNAIIPLFHHSIIPGWKKKDGWLETPYYQAFLEIPIYYFYNPFG